MGKRPQVCGSETQLAPSAKVNVAANWTKQYAVGWALFGAPNSFVLTKLLEDLALWISYEMFHNVSKAKKIWKIIRVYQGEFSFAMFEYRRVPRFFARLSDFRIDDLKTFDRRRGWGYPQLLVWVHGICTSAVMALSGLKGANTSVRSRHRTGQIFTLSSWVMAGCFPRCWHFDP